jgi:hypothetical protein
VFYGTVLRTNFVGSTHISGKRNALDLPESWFWQVFGSF